MRPPSYFTRPELKVLFEQGDVVTFRDLPEPAQLALVHFMAIDGEAWEMAPELDAGYEPGWDKTCESWASYLRRSLPFYLERYGGYRIGFAPCVPAEELKEAVINDPELLHNFKGDWDKYHAWYTLHVQMPTYRVYRGRMWPVILSEFEDETLMDGWHRFHHYMRRGVECIPVLFYVDQNEPLTVQGRGVVGSPNIGPYATPQDLEIVKLTRQEKNKVEKWLTSIPLRGQMLIAVLAQIYRHGSLKVWDFWAEHAYSIVPQIIDRPYDFIRAAQRFLLQEGDIDAFAQEYEDYKNFVSKQRPTCAGLWQTATNTQDREKRQTLLHNYQACSVAVSATENILSVGKMLLAFAEGKDDLARFEAEWVVTQSFQDFLTLVRLAPPPVDMDIPETFPDLFYRLREEWKEIRPPGLTSVPRDPLVVAREETAANRIADLALDIGLLAAHIPEISGESNRQYADSIKRYAGDRARVAAGHDPNRELYGFVDFDRFGDVLRTRTLTRWSETYPDIYLLVDALEQLGTAGVRLWKRRGVLTAAELTSIEEWIENAEEAIDRWRERFGL